MQKEMKELCVATNLFTASFIFSFPVAVETCFQRLKQHVTKELVKRMNGSSLAALCCIFSLSSRGEKEKDLVSDTNYRHQETLFLIL